MSYKEREVTFKELKFKNLCNSTFKYVNKSALKNYLSFYYYYLTLLLVLLVYILLLGKRFLRKSSTKQN